MKQIVLSTVIIALVLLMANAADAKQWWQLPALLLDTLNRVSDLEANQTVIIAQLEAVEQGQDQIIIQLQTIEQNQATIVARLDALEAAEDLTDVVGLTLLSTATDIEMLLENYRAEWGHRANNFVIGSRTFKADGTAFEWNTTHQQDALNAEQALSSRLTDVLQVIADYKAKIATLTQTQKDTLLAEYERVADIFTSKVDNIVQPQEE